jgi:hypothetical protein
MEVVSLNIALCVQVDLSMEDIETILNTLIYDGKVEMTIIAAKEGTVGSVDGQMKLYRGVNPIIQPTGLVKTPCGLCPVSPPSQAIAAKWLRFNIHNSVSLGIKHCNRDIHTGYKTLGTPTDQVKAMIPY